jgi:hypothetical protein
LGGVAQGALIGLTAGINFGAGSAYFGSGFGAAIGVITFLGIFPGVAHDDTYKGILSWSSYLMPMSWPGHAVGLTLFALNVVGYLVTFGQVDSLKIQKIRVDWEKGIIHTEGGWITGGNPTPGSGAFSAGNFVWFQRGQFNEATLQHEEGHSLNNAAFGVLQLYNFLDEALVFNNGAGAYFERLAESNADYQPGGGRNNVTRPPIEQWGPGVTP